MVETLIFLAVSGAMFVAVMGIIGGQQAKTEFQTGVRDFESQLGDLGNDVSTGTSNFSFNNSDPKASCKIEKGTLTRDVAFNSVAVSPTQERCIFVGRVLQFAPDANKGTYRVYSMAGQKQKTGTTNDVTSLVDAAPVALVSVNGITPSDLSELINLPGGVQITSVKYNSGGNSVGAFGFFTTFVGDTVNSGSINVNIAAINNTSLGQSESDAVGAINDPSNVTINPFGGITICLDSDGSDQHADMGIGTGNAGQLTVSSTINNGRCP